MPATTACSSALSNSDCLICSFCSSDQDFAADFLQIPPRDGHPCLELAIPTIKLAEDLHLLVYKHAGRTTGSS